MIGLWLGLWLWLGLRVRVRVKVMVRVGVRVRIRVRIRVNLTLTLTKPLELNLNLLLYWDCCQNMVRKKKFASGCVASGVDLYHCYFQFFHFLCEFWINLVFFQITSVSMCPCISG